MSKWIYFLLFIGIVSQSAAQVWESTPGSPIVKDGRFDDIYFVNDSTGWAVNGRGQILHTTNFGSTWTEQLQVSLYFRSVEFINDSTGFAGCLSGQIFKTTDRGETWRELSIDPSQKITGVCGITHHGSNITMVGIWNGPAQILRSTDFGETWQRSLMTTYAMALVDCWYKSEDTVFVSGRGANGGGVILRSVDNGENWERVTSETTPAGIVWKLQMVSSKIGYASLYQSPSPVTSFLKTIDGGATWQVMEVVNRNIDAEGIGFLNEQKGWIGGWSNGIYETVDGGASWKYINTTRNINRFFIIREDFVYAAGERIYRYKKKDAIDPVTGTEDSEEPYFINDFEAYPNPAREKLKIVVSIRRQTMADLTMYDLRGRVVKTFTHEQMSPGEYKFECDVKLFRPGEYLISLHTNEHAFNKRIVLK